MRPNLSNRTYDVNAVTYCIANLCSRIFVLSMLLVQCGLHPACVLSLARSASPAMSYSSCIA